MTSANASFDDSEISFRSPISFAEHEYENTPHVPTKTSSPQEFSEPVLHHENKIYTIFESPATSPSENEEEGEAGAKVSDDNNNLTDMTGLSYYYQNIITKQVLKTCL